MLSRDQLVLLLEASLLDLNEYMLAEILAAWNVFDPRGSVVEYSETVLTTALSALIDAEDFAAEISGQHVADMAAAAGVPAGPRIDPRAFSGIASDGRNLASLLVGPLMAARQVGISGGTPLQMREVGAESFRTIATTQVFDIARSAQAAAQVANRYVVGYARKVEAGACDRCLLLSGRIYRWSQGFKRHPRCKCTMSEVMRGDDTEIPSPEQIFQSMSAAEQNATFGEANAQAIRDGADMAQVVNAKRGMATAGEKSVTPGVKYTTEGTTRRGYYSHQRRAIDEARGVKTAETATNVGRRGNNANYVVRRIKAPRLMPEEIYKQAAGDRDEAIRLLTGNGYIVGDIRSQASGYVARTPAPIPLG